jgi:endonuclease/exonuclease/phosphatase family metal-dependent hydrolase
VYARGVHIVDTQVPKGGIWGRMSDHLPLLVELAWAKR